MKLLKLHARSYRSLRDVDVALNDLNVFIGAIAGSLDAATIEQRSPSFRDFVAAVLNGSADAPPAGAGSRRS